METIIGLLIVVLPMVFKLIGKKLEQAAQTADSKAEPVEDWAEVLRRHLEAQQQTQAVGAEPENVTKESVTVKPAVPKAKAPAAPKAVKMPVLKEEPKKEREKIDVKKMIVYSEIMKPKYTE